MHKKKRKVNKITTGANVITRNKQSQAYCYKLLNMFHYHQKSHKV